MMLKCDRIADLLENQTGAADPLCIRPEPNIAELRASGAASVDLRLGTWFLTLRQSRFPCLEVDDCGPGESRVVRRYYIPFGRKYILHPSQLCSWCDSRVDTAAKGSCRIRGWKVLLGSAWTGDRDGSGSASRFRRLSDPRTDQPWRGASCDSARHADLSVVLAQGRHCV